MYDSNTSSFEVFTQLIQMKVVACAPLNNDIEGSNFKSQQCILLKDGILKLIISAIYIKILKFYNYYQIFDNLQI
jgi:hypothetical protein